MMLDDALKMLSEEHRRHIMYVIDEGSKDSYTYDEILDGISEKGYLDEGERERFQVQMAHVHLPKMQESGLVEHDVEQNLVHYVGHEDLSELLEDLEKYDNSSSHF